MGAIAMAFVNGFLSEVDARKMLAEVFELSELEIDAKISAWKLSRKYI